MFSSTDFDGKTFLFNHCVPVTSRRKSTDVVLLEESRRQVSEESVELLQNVGVDAEECYPPIPRTSTPKPATKLEALASKKSVIDDEECYPHIPRTSTPKPATKLEALPSEKSMLDDEECYPPIPRTSVSKPATKLEGQVIRGNRGGYVLIYDGYRYQRNRNLVSSTR
ncbi:uncharacterized protein [Watersipora subatra]|uniref:uncharacterized protein n=1 Tax=Watersipora subatra TaxID=2589382 RepID=UPI00355AD1F5